MTYYYTSELYHHGIKGQKWGVRRFQNEDGSLTPAANTLGVIATRGVDYAITKSVEKKNKATGLQQRALTRKYVTSRRS